MYSTLLVLGLLVVAVAALGTSTDFYVAALSAILAYLSAINVWLWGRCRSWPVVEATFKRLEYLAEPHELRIVYTFANETFDRPAPTRGSIGDSLSLRVNPSEPGHWCLDLPRPNVWLAARDLSRISWKKEWRNVPS